jgi:hypothetical protein
VKKDPTVSANPIRPRDRLPGHPRRPLHPRRHAPTETMTTASGRRQPICRETQTRSTDPTESGLLRLRNPGRVGPYTLLSHQSKLIWIRQMDEDVVRLSELQAALRP